ncbi:MAG: molecular chaperone TorD family protein [Acidobacteria bacterium]|nr:molecular chaperone TorD family protein [Acidobacteriota bacterium]MCL5288833.1 molecular chaperone TorD family protein [Acidobacteriota bacterium]
METSHTYDSLAALLVYPSADYQHCVTRAVEVLASVDAQGAASLEHFAEQIRGLSTEELQERFIQTFDMNPSRSLEAGWHLFGENYDRGTFLVKMRQQLRRLGIAESGELPDHITHVLAVLGRMPAGEAEEFAVACVFPALEKMRAGFDDNKEGNPFKDVLDALASMLRGQHGDALLDAAAGAPALRVLQGSELR